MKPFPAKLLEARISLQSQYIYLPVTVLAMSTVVPVDYLLTKIFAARLAREGLKFMENTWKYIL